MAASGSVLTAMIVSLVLHPGQVLHRSRDPEGEVHLRLHGLARLADLPGAAHPASVDDGLETASVAPSFSASSSNRATFPARRSRGLLRVGTGRQ